MSVTLEAAPTADLDKARAQLDAEGYCIVPNVLSPKEIAAIKARLIDQAAGEDARGVGSHDGGPTRPNQRVFMLLNKGKVFRDLMLHPIIDELMGHLLGPDFLISSLTANIARPGGDNMGLHTDQGYVGFWTPVPAVANIAWMLDDFTADNGGTRLVPRSHRFALDGSPRASDKPLTPEQIPTQAHTIGAEGPAGSILCFDGRVFHGTGANKSDRQRHALLSYHCRPWVRTQENSTIGLDPEIRASERPELLNRLGFKVWAGLGRVEAGAANATLHVSPGAIPALNADGSLLSADVR